MNDVTPVKQIR